MEDSHLSKRNAAIVWGGGGGGVQISRNMIKINSKQIFGADKNTQIERQVFFGIT